MGNAWDLVGSDPAPGDAATIDLMGRDIEHTSTVAQEIQLVLGSISCELATARWLGEAAQAYGKAFSRLEPELGLMVMSYNDVGSALRTYASELDSIQSAARQALVRAQLADQQKADAEAREADASKRTSDLSRQSFTVSLSEKQWEASQNLAAATSNLVAYQHAQHQLDSIRATKRAVHNALTAAQSDLNRARNDAGQAADSLAHEREIIAGLASDRYLAEKHAAVSIDGALATGLKNDSNFERMVQWSEKELVAFVQIANAPADLMSGNVQKAIADVDKTLGALADVITLVHNVVMPVLMVATVVVGGTAAIALVVVGLATLQPELVIAGAEVGYETYTATETLAKANQAIDAAGKVIDVAKAGVDAELYQAHYIDPQTGEQMITTKDLVLDGVTVASVAGDKFIPDSASGVVKIVGLANTGVGTALTVKDDLALQHDIFSNQSAELRGGDGAQVGGVCRVNGP